MRSANALCGALATALCVTSLPASAETLRVTGIYPAASDAALEIETIAIEAFTGDQGPSLEFAIKDELDAVRVAEFGKWFYVVPTSGEDVQAVVRGSANYEVLEERLESKRKTTCLEKDEDKKCIKERVRFIPCRQITVRFYPDVRLMAVDGRDLYSHSAMQEASNNYCEDDSSIPTVEGLLRPMQERIARGMRLTLAPIVRSENVRLLESRKGLSKEDRKLFKKALKLTKSDPVAACDAFRSLEANNATHVSVLFNTGLCHESEENPMSAEGYYRAALEIDAGKAYPEMGLDRIRDRFRASEQLSVRTEFLASQLESSEAVEEAD